MKWQIPRNTQVSKIDWKRNRKSEQTYTNKDTESVKNKNKTPN